MSEQGSLPGRPARAGSPDAPPPADPGPLGLGVIPDILLAPGRAFARLAARPRWVGPFAAALVLAALGGWLSLSAVLDYSAEAAEAMMTRMGAPEEARAEALARMPDADDRSAKVLLQNVGGAALLTGVFGLLGAGVLHLIARIAGRVPTFRQTLALFSGAFVVTGLGALVKGALIASAGSVEVTLGPGALFPDLAYHSLPAILLDLLDVFSLWNLALLTIGGAAVWGAARGTSLGICGTYWLLKAVVVAGGRALQAWMTGA
jgi:hypothetical protein